MNSAETARIATNVKGLFFTRYLWLAYVTVFFGLGGAIAVTAWFGQKHLESAAASETHAFAVALDELNRRQVQAMAIPLQYVSGEIDAHGGLDKFSGASLKKLFDDTKASLPAAGVRDIFAVDNEGTVLGTSQTILSKKGRPSYRGHPEFEYVKKQKGPMVLTSIVSSFDGQNMLVLVKMLRTKSGRFAGLIGVTKTFNDFEKFYQSLQLPVPVSFAMLRGDGKILYFYPQEDSVLITHMKTSNADEGSAMGRSLYINDDAPETRGKGVYKFATSYDTMIYVGYDADKVFSTWYTVLKGGAVLFSIFMIAMAILVRLVQRRQKSLENLMEEFRRRDVMIRKIQIPTEALTGETFLKELVLQLCSAFEVNNVVVGVLLPEHTDVVKCMVNYVDGEFLPPQEYNLRLTPFQGLEPGEFFIHTKSTSRIFPEDPILGHQNIESCLGVVLQNSEREAIGILMVYSEREMAEISLKRAILSVFASRVGAELDRVHTDEVRKEVEILRKQIAERSMLSKKMEAIGSLAEGLAHDFNNILAVALASTEKLLNMHKGSVQDEHYLDAIKKSCHRARHLVSQISIFSQREESGSQTPVSMRKLFLETKEFLKSILSEKIHIDLDLGECGDLEISADTNQMQQALMNLCLNASRNIGPQGGEIGITLQKNRIKGRAYIKWIIHHGGDELGRDEIEKIFNPFYAENVGMVVVQRIISNHRGFIEVKSEGGQGTDYEIFIPVLASEIKAVNSNNLFWKTDKMVLIVDDEPEIGLLIKELLEIEGLRVQAETDPVRALRIFQETPDRYFMIISDLAMPEMSGFELCRRIRDLNKNIPFILWSGYYQYLDQELQNLNVKVLSKPVDAKKLLQLINAEVSQLTAQDTLTAMAAPGTSPSART